MKLDIFGTHGVMALIVLVILLYIAYRFGMSKGGTA